MRRSDGVVSWLTCLLRSRLEGIILRTTMLSASENETLTRVGRGTTMGELMRRYWQPVAAVAQLDEHPTLPVRLMGEDLVLYKDTRGGYGLLDRHCPHRRADLCNGVPEERGLRCHYHGWLFDGTARACTSRSRRSRAPRRASRTRSGPRPIPSRR